MSLVAPCCLVLSPSVLQVEHGILLLVLAIGRWCINKGAAHLLRALTPEQYLLHIAVGHVFHRVEVLVVGRNLDTTLPARRTVIVQRTRVVDDAAIDGQVVVVEALVQRTFGLACERAVVGFLEFRTSTTAQSEADGNLIGMGNIDTEAGVAL